MTKYELAIKALQKIANPILHLQDRATSLGMGVHGKMAVALSNDPEYLKRIAQDALQDIENQSEKYSPKISAALKNKQAQNRSRGTRKYCA